MNNTDEHNYTEYPTRVSPKEVPHYLYSRSKGERREEVTLRKWPTLSIT